MAVDAVELERFRLEGVLGEGADLQVFAATDTESGQPVVLKRPHPTLIERSRHEDVEDKLDQSIRLREEVALPHVSRLVGRSQVRSHNAYFGDALQQPYLVSVEERAAGLPLVGSAVDGVKGLPIGLPQNLFALHPLQVHSKRGPFSIQRDILDIAEALYGVGYLLLDVSPMNVYFDPLGDNVTLIDIGSVTVEQPATRRRAPVDLHDFCLELLKWYATAASPPGEASGYRTPHGMDSVAMFTRDLAWMRVEFSALAYESLATTAVGILERVSDRGYGSFDEFRRDFERYLVVASEMYRELSKARPASEAWRAALAELRDPYWRKFLFEPERDLAPYDATD